MSLAAFQSPDPSAAIRLADLTKTYSRSARAIHALRGVTLQIASGERVALLGRSGSGKSTLLNLLGGLDRPTSGHIQVAGVELSRLCSRELAHFRQRAVGMIFQSFNLIPSRTALQNVILPLIFAGVPRRQRRPTAERALEAVGLGQRLDHRPNQLSGGEQQRVAIARALVNDPLVLLADEPTGNLDSATANDIIALLTDHVRRQRMTLVLVTHDEDLAGRATDRVVRLRDGELIS